MTKLLFSLLLLSRIGFAQEAAVNAIIQRAHVTGIQLVYTNKDKQKTYTLGLSGDSSGKPVTQHTVFQAASLSKTVVAYTTLRLVDRGLIALDKPLLDYVADHRLDHQADAKKITARMVLSHTSGLPNWATNPMSKDWATSPLSLKFKPGSNWSYSGEGFALLQKVLEAKSGMPLNTLVQHEVFTPLGMTQSSFTWRADYDTLGALGHDKTGATSPRAKFTQANAAYSLLTTATDYNRFLQALMAGKGLSARTHRMMRQPAGSADRFEKPKRSVDSAISWGLGVGLQQTTQGQAIWHWGDNGDFKGFFIAYPGQQKSVIYFTNSENGLEITKSILTLFLGAGPYPALEWLQEDE